MDFSIGSSACHIAVSQKRKAVDVELYINDDKELFKSLFAYKDEIEKNMEMELEWKELPERKASRILIEKTVDLDDRATWPEQCGGACDFCNGCDNLGGGAVDAFYEPYINGEKELRELNEEYRSNTGLVK